MADKYHSDTQEKITSSIYSPGLPGSGDLETGTKTITATSEASGVGNADYNASLTLAKPDDARILVRRLGVRLAVTIDSFDTATHLYCRVYVDVQDAGHMIFDLDWENVGAKLAVTTPSEWTMQTIFDLLKDGAEHTFYFFFWVDQANNAVISQAQLWEGVGTGTTSSAAGYCFQIQHQGLMSFTLNYDLLGTGSAKAYFGVDGGEHFHSITDRSVSNLILGSSIVDFDLYGTVATDLNYIYKLTITLRSA